MIFKTCSKCKINKKLECFRRVSRSKDNKDTICKSCRKNYRCERKEHFNKRAREYNKKWRDANPEKLKITRTRIKLKKYGLTIKQYNEMLKEQNGVCAICEIPPSEKRALAVDHCHKTNKIRGLLCHKCNKAIGMLGDNFMSLSSAEAYLLKSVAKVIDNETNSSIYTNIWG